MVGNVAVGGDAPISVQSMTNTSTGDVAATVAQINRIQAAGADIVRVSVPSLEEAEAFGQIRKLVMFLWWQTFILTTILRFVLQI